MALMYISISIAAACGLAGLFGELPGIDEFAETEDLTVVEVTILLVFCFPAAVLFAVGLGLPRRPWAWIYGIVLIALGLTSCLCLPFTVPLLVFWLKPETGAYFGRKPARRPDDDHLY